jgi:type IV pilus assembly protein PilO
MNRRALLIGAGAAFLILVMWYFLLWSPRSSAVGKARERANAAEAHAQELTLQLKRLKAAQKDEPLKRAKLERLRTAVPDDPALAQLILDVNDAANRSGIDFMSIAPAIPVASTTGGPPQIALTLSVTGGYFQVIDFLNRLAALPRVVVVDGVNLTPGQNGRISASITGRTFLAALTTTNTTVVSGATTTTVAGAPTTTAPSTTSSSR